jgi:hypothetical protein
LLNTDICQHSPFLAEIPKELIQYHEKESDVPDDAEAENFIAQMRAIFK